MRTSRESIEETEGAPAFLPRTWASFAFLLLTGKMVQLRIPIDAQDADQEGLSSNPSHGCLRGREEPRTQVLSKLGHLRVFV